MNRNILIAPLAALATIGSPSAVEATTLTDHDNPQNGIQSQLARLATEIVGQNTHSGLEPNSLAFDKGLPGGEHASVTFGSENRKLGKPDPHNPSFIAIEVLPSVKNISGSKLPIVDIVFNKNGKTWDASKSSSITSRNGNFEVVSEVGQSSTHTFIESISETPTDSVIKIAYAKHQRSAKAANLLLNNLVMQAQLVLDKVVHNQKV